MAVAAGPFVRQGGGFSYWLGKIGDAQVGPYYIGWTGIASLFFEGGSFKTSVLTLGGAGGTDVSFEKLVVLIALFIGVLPFGLTFWSIKLSANIASPSIVMQSDVPMVVLLAGFWPSLTTAR